MRALKLVLVGCGVSCDSTSTTSLSEVWSRMASADVALSSSPLAVGVDICEAQGSICVMQIAMRRINPPFLELAQRRNERLVFSFWGVAPKKNNEKKTVPKTFNKVQTSPSRQLSQSLARMRRMRVSDNNAHLDTL
jgi:hypothetical protein